MTAELIAIALYLCGMLMTHHFIGAAKMLSPERYARLGGVKMTTAVVVLLWPAFTLYLSWEKQTNE